MGTLGQGPPPRMESSSLLLTGSPVLNQKSDNSGQSPVSQVPPRVLEGSAIPLDWGPHAGPPLYTIRAMERRPVPLPTYSARAWGTGTLTLSFTLPLEP